MNNSFIVSHETSISLEEQVDNTEKLREIESQHVKIIEAIDRIRQSEDWSTLKSHIFNSTVENLEKRLKSEAEQLIINVPQLNNLQGQLIWARKYASLDKLSESYRLELSNIRKQLLLEAKNYE